MGGMKFCRTHSIWLSPSEEVQHRDLHPACYIVSADEIENENQQEEKHG